MSRWRRCEYLRRVHTWIDAELGFLHWWRCLRTCDGRKSGRGPSCRLGSLSLHLFGRLIHVVALETREVPPVRTGADEQDQRDCDRSDHEPATPRPWGK